MGSIAKKILEQIDTEQPDNLTDIDGLLDRAGHRPHCKRGSDCGCGYSVLTDAATRARVGDAASVPDARDIAATAGPVFGHSDTCSESPCSCGAADVAGHYALNVRGASIVLRCDTCSRSFESEPGAPLYAGDDCPADCGDFLTPIRVSLFDKVPGVPF